MSQKLPRPDAELTLESVFDAYFDCRRHKRNTLYQLAFEADLERNLLALWRDLRDGTYQIGRSIAFVVQHPKTREVWAASFRDRIVHHLIYNAIRHRFYAGFIRDSYACIPGRGTHDGCCRISGFARSVTRNWTRQAFVLKADVASFFTSINRHVVLMQVEVRVHEEWLRRLIRQVVLHDPREGAILRSSQALFAKVPRHKSLWHAPEGFGLPIGNLTSQFFANVHLDALDQFAKHDLHAHYYGRYVDDILMFDESPDVLNERYAKMERFLLDRLGLHLHPNKKKLHPVAQGIDFVGFIIKPGRTYLRNASLARCKQKIRAWEREGSSVDPQRLEKLGQSITSYLGMLRQVNGFRARQHLCQNFRSLFIYADAECTKLVVP
ncbi:MAG: RNA-directed DNA polymerase [Alphaproteobacteria bacterium]|nr:RNA-directed DNA polymerase [Alphaproteobacteria bacterium]